MGDTEVATADRQVIAGTLEGVITSSAMEAITRSELDVQIVTARRFPRSLAHFKARALTMIRLDVETAQSCFYVLPRRQRQADGTFKRVTIDGPGVRLAEIAQVAYGNIRAGARIVAETDREVVAQGFCHDLETNTAVVMEVQRRIVDGNGRRYSDDMITMTKNAACSIARRNAVFAVIPRAFINPLLEAAKKVAAGDAKTLSESRTRALAAFAEIGVSATAVCDKLERRGVEDIDLEDLTLLSGLLTAIRERETTVEAEFPPVPGEPTGSRTAAVAETLARRRRAADQATGRGAESPATPPPAAPPETPTPPTPSETP
ncbi:MAG TPA: hypothetical protein VKV41_25385 [Methylomirabilota bacterium]|nr:hypothetical protein [Methylomirabilota bacterium]